MKAAASALARRPQRHRADEGACRRNVNALVPEVGEKLAEAAVRRGLRRHARVWRLAERKPTLELRHLAAQPLAIALSLAHAPLEHERAGRAAGRAASVALLQNDRALATPVDGRDVRRRRKRALDAALGGRVDAAAKGDVLGA